MSEQPAQYTSKYNPKGIDYNRDREVDSLDDQWAVQDFNKDGKVTEKEKTKFRQKRDETSTEYVYNDKGELVETKTKGSGVEIPEPSLDFSEYTKAFLANRPGVAKVIRDAIKYGWTQEQFNRTIEKTGWGKSTTDAQAAFDLQIQGSKSEDLLDQIEARRQQIERQVIAAGVSISPEEIATFARNAVRSALDDADVRGWIASKFRMGGATGPTGPADGTGQGVVTGTAANIGDYLREMARQYGLPITSDFMQQKIQEGLNQTDWQQWAEGQRNIFRQQAKMAYPSISSQLDSFTLDEILTPYLNAASNMLGIPKAQMKLDDPMWNEALKGEGGPMSLDQWMSKLRTDSKYGWDKTTAARREYMDLADELLSAFGMA